MILEREVLNKEGKHTNPKQAQQNIVEDDLLNNEKDTTFGATKAPLRRNVSRKLSTERV